MAYLVRGWVLRKADVAVDPENDVLEGQLGNSFVGFDDFLAQCLDVRLPVHNGPAVLGIIV